MRYITNSFKLLIFSLFLFSCEERVELDYVNFTPGSLSDNDGKVTYSDVDVYPILSNISTDTPSVDNSIKTGIVFSIDSVKAPAESTYDNSKFSIDKPSGVVTYNNSAGGLSEGNYSISVSVDNANGVAKYDDAVTIKVLSVPIQINIDNADVNVGSLEIGEIATASVTDLSGSGVVEMITYQLIDAPDIYTINETTGVISKVKAATSGSVKLTVQVGSNLGAVVAQDLLTVTVGAAPTISFLQQDGSTPLSRVTVSPYTSYTSFAPVLTDMTAASWAIILPAALDNFANSFGMGSSGEITIASDANLPEGDYKIGVIPTNAGGISLEFPEVLSLKVENRSAVVFEDLINGPGDNVAPNTVTGWTSYVLSGTENDGAGWKKMGAVAGKWSCMRRWMKGGTTIGDSDESVVREIDLSSIDKTKPTTIVFTEFIGYGAAFTNKYDRAVYVGDDTTSIASGTWSDLDWVAVQGLGLGGTDWLGINWNGGNGPVQGYSKSINLNTIEGDKLYVNWRMKFKEGLTGQQNGQWGVNDIRIEQPDVYTAEEE